MDPFDFHKRYWDCEHVNGLKKIVYEELRGMKRVFYDLEKEKTCFKFGTQQQAHPTWSKVIKYHDHDFLDSPYTSMFAATADMCMVGPLASEIRDTYGKAIQFFFDQEPRVGDRALLGPRFTGKKGKYVYALPTKMKFSKSTNLMAWASCLREVWCDCSNFRHTDLAIPTLDPGLDGIPWKTTYRILDYLFKDRGVKIHAYTHFYTSKLYEIQAAEDMNDELIVFTELDDAIFDEENRKMLPVRDGFKPYSELKEC